MDYVELDYEPVGYKDYPSTSTKLNAENLNKPDKGIMMLIKAVKELRDVLGSEDLTKNYTGVIAAINDLGTKFGGYSGYNLLDFGLIAEETNGYVISGTLDEIGLSVNKSYTLSMESDADIYFYQFDSSDDIISVETLTDLDKAASFTIAGTCVKVKAFFPKTMGYVSESICKEAKLMLEEGTEKHEYEPYTGGEEMSDLWEEILENQNELIYCKKSIRECESFILGFMDLLEGSY